MEPLGSERHGWANPRGRTLGDERESSGARWTSATRPQAENGDVRVNALEKKWVDSTREQLGQPSDLALLQKTFDRMK